jgi:serine acetyltransferase
MPEDRENRKHLDLGAVVLQDVRLDSTVKGVPAHIVYRITGSSYASFTQVPLESEGSV